MVHLLASYCERKKAVLHDTRLQRVLCLCNSQFLWNLKLEAYIKEKIHSFINYKIIRKQSSIHNQRSTLKLRLSQPESRNKKKCSGFMPWSTCLRPKFRSYSALSLSLSDMLCNSIDLIWRKGTPFEGMTGHTAFINRSWLRFYWSFPKL